MRPPLFSLALETHSPDEPQQPQTSMTLRASRRTGTSTAGPWRALPTRQSAPPGPSSSASTGKNRTRRALSASTTPRRWTSATTPTSSRCTASPPGPSCFRLALVFVLLGRPDLSAPFAGPARAQDSCSRSSPSARPRSTRTSSCRPSSSTSARLAPTRLGGTRNTTGLSGAARRPVPT